MKTSICVVIAHFLVVASLFYFQAPSIKTAQRPRIAVRVLTPLPPKTIKVDQPQTLVSSETFQKAETATLEVKSKPPLPPNIKPVIKPLKSNPTVKSSTVSAEKLKSNVKQEKLIALMQQSLQHIEVSTSIKPTTELKPAGIKIAKLASETLTFETNYEEELIAYLQSTLSLPEKKDVKLKLTLKREGSVQKIDILHSESVRNKTYVESKLTSWLFPPFGSHFKNETAHTFTITLKCR